jgi:tetratricopeptide (TPR) repeat protein
MLDARIKSKRGKQNEARDALERWKLLRLESLGQNASEADKSAIDGELAIAYIELEDFASADRLFDSLAQTAIDKAFESLTIACRARSLPARSYALGRLTELIKPRSTAENGIQLMRLLSSQEFESVQLRNADALLLQIQAAQESNPKFMISMGDMWLSRKAIERAIDSYRKLLIVDPNNIIAMNNIACLVAEETGKTDESLTMIDKAIEVAGRSPDLLDSKGHILSIAGRHADAVPWFEEAAAKGTDPRAWLHLFSALKKSGRSEEAAKIRSKIDFEAIRKLHLSPEEEKEIESLEVGRDRL